MNIQEIKAALPTVSEILDSVLLVANQTTNIFGNMILTAECNGYTSSEQFKDYLLPYSEDKVQELYQLALADLGSEPDAKDVLVVDSFHRYTNETPKHNIGDWKLSILPRVWQTNISAIGKALDADVLLIHNRYHCPEHGKFNSEVPFQVEGADCPTCELVAENIPKGKSRLEKDTQKAMKGTLTSSTETTTETEGETTEDTTTLKELLESSDIGNIEKFTVLLRNQATILAGMEGKDKLFCQELAVQELDLAGIIVPAEAVITEEIAV